LKECVESATHFDKPTLCHADRALLVGTALLGCAAAAAASLLDAPTGAVGAAALMAPCPLPGPHAPAVLLQCSVQLGSGAVQLASVSAHKLPQQHAACVALEVHAAPDHAAFKSSPRPVWLPTHHALGSKAAAGSVASLAAPRATLDSWAHPASADASLHLSAVNAAALTSSATTLVPVSVQAFTAATGGGEAPASGWAAVGVALPRPAESLTQASLLAAAAPAATCSISGLVAKAVGGSRRTPAQSQEMLYAVDWQAATWQPAAPAAPGGGVPLLTAWGGAGSRLFLSAGNTSSATGAVSTLLQALQALPGAAGAARWQLHADSGGCAPPGGGRLDTSAPAAALHALLKVAASEGALASQAAIIHSSGAAPGAGAWQEAALSKQHGAAARGPVALHPLLLPAQPAPSAALSFEAPSNVAVTGALGGLGLLLCRWLLAHGARRLLLLGRSVRGAAGEQLAAGGGGCAITAFQADISSVQDVAGAVAGHAVQAVFHASGAVQDASLARQTAAGMRAVHAPKASGWERLASACSSHPLHQSVVFSSIAGTLGSAGQANYAAANAALDARAAAAQQAGQRCLSVQWGAWSGAGMAAAHPALLSRLQAQGYGVITPAAGLAALRRLLGAAPERPAALASGFNWGRFLGSAGRAAPPFYSAVAPTPAAAPAWAVGPAAAAAPVGQQQSSAAPLPPLVAAAALLPELQELFRSLAGDVPAAAHTPLLEAGLDSIGAVELRNALAERHSVALPATLAFDYPTLGALSAHLAESINAKNAALQPGGTAATSAAAAPLPSLLAVAARLAALVADVAGVEAAPDQPLMEVRL
jgi:acyl carrier protein